jgi:hypothetical protein
MHEPLLALAALPAPAAICGIPLHPYSLGHELYLTREQSPFVFGGTVLPEDLFDATWICSSTFNELRAAPHRFSYIPKLWLTRRRFRRCNHELEIEAFRNYRDSGSLELPLSDIANPDAGPAPRPPGAPFILRLHHFMVTHYRLSIDQAWDFPCGEAKMRWAAHWEQEGGLSIKNYHDEDFDRFVMEQEAKGRKQCPA